MASNRYLHRMYCLYIIEHPNLTPSEYHDQLGCTHTTLRGILAKLNMPANKRPKNYVGINTGEL